MRPPFQVIDSDGHINEPEEIIATYLPPPYDAYLHAWKPNAEGAIHYNNTLVPKQPGMDPTMGGTLGTNGPAGFPFPSDWLAIMDEAGVEKTYLYPTAFLPYSMMVDPEYTVAVTRAYNSFIHDHWLQVNDRFGAVAVMPLLDAEESAKELRRSVTELGFAGAFTPAVGYGLIGRKQNHPFFAEAQDLDTTVAIHGGHATAEYIPYTRFIQRHAVGFPVSQIIQMTSLALEGIFELFPTLRVAFLEAGCTWVPYMLDRLDERNGSSAARSRPPTASALPANTYAAATYSSTLNPTRNSSLRPSTSSATTPWSTLPTGLTGTTTSPTASTTSGVGKTSQKVRNGPSSGTIPSPCTASVTRKEAFNASIPLSGMVRGNPPRLQQ